VAASFSTRRAPWAPRVALSWGFAVLEIWFESFQSVFEGTAHVFPHRFCGCERVSPREYFYELLMSMRGSGGSRFGSAEPGGGEHVVFLDRITQRLTSGAFSDAMMELLMEA